MLTDHWEQLEENKNRLAQSLNPIQLSRQSVFSHRKHHHYNYNLCLALSSPPSQYTNMAPEPHAVPELATQSIAATGGRKRETTRRERGKESINLISRAPTRNPASNPRRLASFKTQPLCRLQSKFHANFRSPITNFLPPPLSPWPALVADRR